MNGYCKYETKHVGTVTDRMSQWISESTQGDNICEYQMNCRIYSDEVPMADLKKSRWQEAIINGYDGLYQFET